jgi:hypothetical protein
MFIYYFIIDVRTLKYCLNIKYFLHNFMVFFSLKKFGLKIAKIFGESEIWKKTLRETFNRWLYIQ